MAKFGTAYIDIQPNLDAFGAGLGKKIEAKLAGVGADIHQKVKLDVDTRPLDKLRELQTRLGKLHVGVDVDRKPLDAALADVAKKVSITVDPADLAKLKSVTQDLRAVGGTDASAKLTVKTDQAKAELAIFQQRLSDLNREKVTPEVTLDIGRTMAKIELLEARLAKLSREKAEIKIDVDRSQIGVLGGIANDFGTALRGIATAAGGFLGVGSSFTALGSAAAAAAPLVVGLAVAIGVLAASFGAAVAGATALGIALAGALGPVALVAFAAIARVVAIIKAIHDDGKSAAASTQAVAGAQSQLQAATEGVANAQANLKTQTVAALQAMSDAAEKVKDDLLGVKDAQLGIADASLSLREAQLALKEFKRDAPGLQGLFKKFTDVNVDLTGLKGALAQARKLSGGKLSEDDSLKLERLILNVRQAKLQEKHATDGLHDANVQLQRDRQTEAGFLRHGIAAYPGYTSAVQGLASAQRQLASAQRASAAATTKQAGELAKLSPLERNLAATFVLIGDAVKKAFGPAINAVLGGLNRALGIFVGVLKDPKIVGALKLIGGAIGGVFVTLAKTFSSKQFRDAFVTLAKGGAQLAKILGGKVFKSFALILTDIATAALPALVGLLNSLGDTLDRWAKWIEKHPKQFRKDIDDLVGTFKGWLGVIIDIGGFLLRLGGTLKDFGDTAGRTFRDLKLDVGDFFGGQAPKFNKLNVGKLPELTPKPPKPAKGLLGFSPKDLDTISGAIGRLRLGLSRIIDSLVPGFKNALGGVAGIVRGFVVVVAGLLTGDFAAAWRGVKDIVRGALRTALGVAQLMTAPFRAVGKRLGDVFSSAFRSAIGAIKGVAKKVVSEVVAIINVAIDAINKIIGAIPNIDIPGLGHTRPGKIGHVGDPFAKPKAKRDLNPQHLPVLTKHPQAKPVAAPKVQPFGGARDSASFTTVENVNISAPAAAVPDPRHAAVLFAREIAKRA